jgi:hypothetical protein
MKHKLLVASAAAGAMLLGIGAPSLALGITASPSRQVPPPVLAAKAKAALEQEQALDMSMPAPRPPITPQKAITGYAPDIGAKAPRPPASEPKGVTGLAPDIGERAPGPPSAGPRGATNVQYYNWSGYAATGSAGTFTTVSGLWTVPTESPCTYEHQTDSQWVGFDGFNNSTVEQAGTLLECYYDTPYYYDWYEMYPTEPSTVTMHSVSPGDTVSATVSRSGSSYTLTVTDYTHSADSFTATSTCTTCQNDSAEWINERDGFSCCGYSPLANYGTWELEDGTATASGKATSLGSLANLYDIDMKDATSYYYLATVSAISSSQGSSFTTTWYDTW